eukprot:CAMPEP_0181326414 /NCGR_PEP_ID=MMETSP1101-20121128/21485_1 /TAXON_ID=46948 /ORGANISM="Rhodomonas abbreviata, Strain Caron Lab Isolate" /LENGTH=151 /DNA_ID=CAMNT_0023434865 /DNA_START=76 /DNA_END=531 /DNA_ORIENTATION=-
MATIEDPANMETCWCIYCFCFGEGLGKFTLDPVCKSSQKCCCLAGGGETKLTTDFMGDGFCAQNSQCLCFRAGQQIIPKTPFFEICGIRLFGGSAKMKPQQIMGGGFGNVHAEVDTLNDEIAEAVAKEDFLLAHELKQRRDTLPKAVQMSE